MRPGPRTQLAVATALATGGHLALILGLMLEGGPQAHALPRWCVFAGLASLALAQHVVLVYYAIVRDRLASGTSAP